LSNVHFIMGGAEAVGANLMERLLAQGDRIAARDDPLLAHAMVLEASGCAAFGLVETLHGGIGLAETRHVVSCSRNPCGSGAALGVPRARTIIAGPARAS
jgi:NAD(P)-dependent dehydrogenase (short-subunit alcohol dehydrogenase family)